jgi:hypothetical protein
MLEKPRVQLELDHVIVFVADPDPLPAMFAGFILDSGQRHAGQGTRNRRVPLQTTFIEAAWIEDPEEERQTPLRFGQRCTPAASCPLGVVLRGAVAAPDRDRYQHYQVPGNGPPLLLLTAALAHPGQPFVAVWEGAPRRDRPAPQHPCGARDIDKALLVSPQPPDLGIGEVRNLTFQRGPAELQLHLVGLERPWTIRTSSG